MRVFIFSLCITAAAFAAHLLLWRVRVPRRQTRAIVIIFISVLVLGLAGAFFLNQNNVPWQAHEYARTCLCVLCLLCAYVITYSAFEAQSPTLVMVEKILSAGPGGLEKQAFEASMNDGVLILPRLDDLLRDNMARLENGRYTVTAKGRLMALVFVYFRKLLNLGMGG